ncbi:MAG: ArnT family glycosyltransferase [Gemmatimonadaceae bacterium]
MAETIAAVPSICPPQKSGTIPLWLCIVVGMFAGVLLVIASSRYGLSHHSDSARYTSVARSVTQGAGFTLYDGRAEVWSTPLYPLLLAPSFLLKVNVLAYARWLHAALFILTVAGAVVWLASLRPIWGAWLVGAGLVVTSAPLFDQAITMLTDLTFISFIVIWLIVFDRALESGRLRWIVTAGIVAALAWLTRNPGITTVAVGAILLTLPRSSPLLLRFRDAAVYGVVGSTLSIVWLLRNQLVTGAAVPPLATPSMSPDEYAVAIVQIVGGWFLPLWVPGVARAVLGLVVLGATVATLAVALIKTTRQYSGGQVDLWRRLRTASAFALMYSAFVLTSISLVWVTDWPERYMAPTVVPVVGVIVFSLSYVACLVRRRGVWHERAFLVAAAVSLLAWPARLTVGRIEFALRHGAGGYATDRWQRSTTARFVRSLRPTELVLSNEPNALYFLSKTSAGRWMPGHGLPGTPPSKLAALESLRDSLTSDQEHLVVLFSPTVPELAGYDYTRDEIQSVFQTRLIALLDDGAVLGIRVHSTLPAGK